MRFYDQHPDAESAEVTQKAQKNFQKKSKKIQEVFFASSAQLLRLLRPAARIGFQA
ncbi:hypothetical protein WG902_15725 [Ramlibacter sp. PS3R-8]|uniref:hypothetical protein n=1 Tax=Ramlibacter sp. PS3R-8 TaxID=3133437 RepID=UPI0030A3C576